MEKKCKQCKTVFRKPYTCSKKVWEASKYCSKTCNLLSYPSRAEKVCIECKKTFSVRNYRKDTAHFCSQDCSHKHRNSGKYKADYAIRRYPIYQEWRISIFERDNYTCVTCDVRGGELHADHIKPFAIIIYENKLDTLEKMILCKELWDTENGRTLCASCHRKTDTYGRRSIYFKKSKCIATC